MALDLDALIALCRALDRADDDLSKARDETDDELIAVAEALHTTALGGLELVIGADPEHVLGLLVGEMRRSGSGYAREFDWAFQVLCGLGEEWRHRVIDLAPVVPAMWDVVQWGHHGVDARDVLERLGLDCIVAAWLRNNRDGRPADDETDWWAWQFVHNMRDWADEPTQQRVLLALINAADDDSIWDVAAGPLEDYICNEHGRLLWVQQQARRSHKFIRALRGVWTHGKDAVTDATVRAIAPRE